MFGWLVAIGAGIGAVAFDLGTSACAAFAGTMYGEHRARKEDEKKIKRFRNKVHRELKILNEKYTPKEEKLSDNDYNDHLQRLKLLNKRVSFISDELSKVGVEQKIEKAKNEMCKEMKKDIDFFTENIMNAGTDLFISEKEKTIIKEAKEKINTIKTQIRNGKIITADQVREIYNIFAKKNWLMEKFSPNIVRQDDFIIRELMQEICKKDIGGKNKSSLLELLLKNVATQNQDVEEYKVFFDFLSKYSGVINNDISRAQWEAKYCVLVDEFIKDKEFNMYEDIEELPECCKKIDNIKNICELNINPDDKESYIKQLDGVLKEKNKSLEKQLDEICKQDERLKDGNEALKDAIDSFKDKINGRDIEIFNKEKQSQEVTTVSLANDIITAMNNQQAQINLNIDNNKIEI